MPSVGARDPCLFFPSAPWTLHILGFTDCAGETRAGQSAHSSVVELSANRSDALGSLAAWTGKKEAIAGLYSFFRKINPCIVLQLSPSFLNHRIGQLLA